MMSAAERRGAIERIKRLPDLLEEALRGLTEEQLDTPYRQGGWTPRQVVHHLADSHMNAFVRAKLILTEDRPTLKPYDQDAWASLPDGKRPPVGGSLAIVRGLHSRWGVLLDSVAEADWARSARHPERGDVTLEGILKTYAGHGEKHVQQIAGLRAARGWK